MDSSRDRVLEVFMRVAESESHLRPSLLDQLCGSDAALRRQVDTLLSAWNSASPQPIPEQPIPETIESQAGLPEATVDSVLPDEQRGTVDLDGTHDSSPAYSTTFTRRGSAMSAGSVLGERYTLIEKVGEGGMGEVWLADQSRPVQRKVAIKLIKRGMDSDAVLLRFEQERQALALMDHPNIARVFDGGLTPSGQPFFAMEWVRGDPLNQYCSQNKMSLRERLELFVRICQAVQHAHQKGMIHRDLKPANILVTRVDDQAVPKVIDFGVAKATSGKLVDSTLATQFGAVIGTLEYMSPEQAGSSSEDVDTRADIYSLGVILYELLTGLRPIDAARLKKSAMSEMIRIIREEEPQKPSTRLSSHQSLAGFATDCQVEPRRLMASLRGELDWIVMKCLEKQRSRRYESASSLARDVQRYLAGEAVEACPPSAAYRLKKFVDRHRGPVVVAALLLLLLVLGIAGTSYGLYQATLAEATATTQKELAERAAEEEKVAREQAEQVAELMESVFRSIDPNAAEEVGQSVEAQLVSNLKRLGQQLESYRGAPLSKARLQFSFGQTLMSLGEYAQAEPLLRSAATLRRNALGANAEETLDAEITLSAAVEHNGRFDEALEIMERIRREGRTDAQHDPAWQIEMNHMMGMVYQAAGQSARALPLFEEARDQLAETAGPDTQESLLILHTLGTAYRDVGRTDEAIQILKDVQRRRLALLGPDHRDTLMTDNSLAVAYSANAQFDEAIQQHEANRDRLIKRYGPNHVSVFNTMGNLASVLSAAGQHAEALEMLEDLYERSVSRFGQESLATLRIASYLVNTRLESHQPQQALELIQAIEGPLRSVYDASNPVVIGVQVARARGLAELGQLTQAKELLSSTLEQVTETGRVELQWQVILATLYRRTGQREQAVELLKQIEQQQADLLGNDSRDLIKTLTELGKCYFDGKQADDAVATFERALPLAAKHFGTEHQQTLFIQGNLGAAYWLGRNFDKSIPTLQEALRLKVEHLGPETPDALHTAENLAVCLSDAQQADALYAHLELWLERLLRNSPPTDRNVRRFVPDFLREAHARGEFESTCDVLEIVFQEATSSLGPDHPATLNVMNNLASAHWMAKNLARSLPLLQDLVERSRRVLGESHPSTLASTGSLARNLIDSDRAAEAIPLLQDALSRGRAGSPRLPTDLVFMQRDLGTALAQSGQLEAAKQAFTQAVQDYHASFSADRVQLASGLATIASHMLEQGLGGESEKVLRECLQLRQELAPNAWTTFNTQSMLGEALSQQGNQTEAEELLLSGYRGMIEQADQIPKQAQFRVLEALERLVAFYEQQEDPANIDRWKKERENWRRLHPSQPNAEQ